MKFKTLNNHTRTQVDVIVSIEDGPIIDSMSALDRQMQVTAVHITYILRSDIWRVLSAKATGRRILKDGSIGIQNHESWWFGFHTGDAPDWVQGLVEEYRPQGVPIVKEA